MKTIPIHITTEEAEWLQKKARRQKMTMAQVIEAIVRDAFLYQGEELPPYDWGEAGFPEGDPVEYDPEKNEFVVIEEGAE